MYVLNYLYFLIITVVGYKWLTSSGSMKYPLDKHRRMWLDGPERFWILTFSTGLLALSAPGGLDLMAIRLMALELFACSDYCLFGSVGYNGLQRLLYMSSIFVGSLLD